MAVLTSHWILDISLLLFSVLTAFYLYMTRNFNHWKKKGVLETPPVPFFGNFLNCGLLRTAAGKYFASLYNLAKGQPYVGFYLFDKPALLLRDLDVIKTILIKDFDAFPDRYVSASEADHIGHANLFLLKSPKWRALRQNLRPLFTSGKIKGMFPLINAVGDDLIAHFESLELEGDGRVVELRDIAAKYTTDVVGTCIFGLRVNSLNNPEAEFRKNGRKMFRDSYKRGLEFMSQFFLPSIQQPLGFKIFDAECTEFLRKAFWETFNERLESKNRRNDLIDLLIDLRASQTGTHDPNAFKFEGDNLAAQGAIFFGAGFETSSIVMSCTLHELSLHQHIQTKLQRELTKAMEEGGGELSYDMVHCLPYLNKVVRETLRKYPALPFLDRQADRDYTIEKTGLVIKKGTPVYISLLGLHSNPEYFPDPEIYDPERFSEENKRSRPPYAYMPFGEGPHVCIGLRFGLMQAKIGISKILLNFEIVPCEKTVNQIELNPRAIFLTPKYGLYHRVRKIGGIVS